MADQVGPISYSTVQFSWGGLFDSHLATEGVYRFIHLAPDLATGGAGPLLCGLDRHAVTAPGWSWRGGLHPLPDEIRPACPECTARRDPALAVVGIDAQS